MPLPSTRAPRRPARRARAGLALLCALVPLAGAAPAGAAPPADAAAWMFSPSEVVQIDLTLDGDALDALDTAPREYAPATFELHGSEGRTFGPWAIQLKLKGSASFRPLGQKAAFKLKFPSGSRPSGLKKLTLNNMVQDPSKVREVLAYELFRAMDVPAPRAGYAEVRVNGEDYGLYLNLETLDSVALPRWFASTGHLYESVYEEGQPRSTLEPGGEAEFEVDEGDENDRSDLVALIAALRGGATGSLATVLGDHADLDEMARMLGAEAFLGHWDGYGWSINNFYLHADAAGRFSLLPWGADQTLQSWFPVVGDPWPVQGVLLERCLADEACAAARLAAIERARTLATDLDLAGRAAALHDALRSLIEADPLREHSVAESDTAVADIQAFLAARAPATPPAPAPPAPAPPGPAAPATVEAGPPSEAASPPIAPAAAGPAPRLAVLTGARARGAARRALRARFGRLARTTRMRLGCAPVGPALRRCRARWTSGGVRRDVVVLVRLEPGGRLTARVL